MDVNAAISHLAAELQGAGSSERSVKERAYLKSELDHYGTGVPAIRRATTHMVRAHRPFDHPTLVALVEALWSQPVHELRMAAVEALNLEADLLTVDDVPLLERMLRQSRTWALVDGLSASVVGQLVERYPDEFAPIIERWSTDEDVWVRRSALLANLVALRQGEGDFERFGRIADRLLDDPEFWIRKAIGWVLRDTSRKRPELVAEWLLPRAHLASPLTIREAVKYLDPDDRAAIKDARDPDRQPSRGGERLPHDWDAAYADTPPWDIGRPQTPFVALADGGHLAGAVLDLGCGTGEHALLAAERGAQVTGVDVSPTAIAQARSKADERGLDADFLVHDALEVDALGQTFDVVVDIGFFHVLSDADRPRLAGVLREVMATDALYFMLCFSDKVPGDAGPRRIRQDEIREVFADGFEVEAIDESFIEATFLDVPVPAWLARIRRR